MSNAPIIHFDGVLAYGSLPSLVQVELSADILRPLASTAGAMESESICVAHLRTNPAGALILIEALQRAVDMALKPPEDINPDAPKN